MFETVLYEPVAVRVRIAHVVLRFIVITPRILNGVKKLRAHDMVVIGSETEHERLVANGHDNNVVLEVG